MSTSNKRIPRRVQDLLDIGEHPHVDYKGIRVPDDLAQVVASGANTAALNGPGSVFTLLLGVAERVDASGARSGEPVGVRDDKGDVIRDLTKVEQTVVNLVKTGVTPVPMLDFNFVNTTGKFPFLEVVIKPTMGPYRAGDHYAKRNGSHSAPLETDELLELMKPRWQQVLAAMTADAPLTRRLEELAMEFEILRRDLLEENWRSERVEDKVNEIQHLLASSTTEEGVENLSTALGELEEAIRGDLGVAERDTLADAIQRVERRLDVPTREEALADVIYQRRGAWMAFTHWEALGDMSDEEVALGRALFEAFFLTSPGLDSYERNMGEREGWSLGYQSSPGQTTTSQGRRIMFAASFAATTVSKSLQWDPYVARSDADLEREDLQTLQARVAGDTGDGLTRMVGSLERPREAALLIADAVVVRELIETSGARNTDPAGRVVGLRMHDEEIRVAFPEDAGPIVVTMSPTLFSANRPDAATELRRWRRRLRKHTEFQFVSLSAQPGGMLDILGGHRFSAM